MAALIRKLGFCAILLTTAAILASGESKAGGMILPVGGSYDGLALSCENGRVYPLRVGAVSEIGEIVTGYLVTSPHAAVHVRLIPMGDGYRYAGRGIWFDGKRDVAILYFGEYNAVNCAVVREGTDAIAVKG